MYRLLYSVSTNGYRYWKVEYDINNPKYRIIHGYCDYKTSSNRLENANSTTITNWIYVDGVNKGKSNETTPKEQLLLIIERLIVSKLEKGYFYYGKEPVVRFEVMLAQDYFHHQTKLSKYLGQLDSYELYIQPKLDGIRCYYSLQDNVAYSRNHKQFQHITQRLNSIINIKDNIILDGELYSNSLAFSDISSAVQVGDLSNIKFNVFDCYSIDQPDLVFSQRFSMLKSLIDKLHNNNFIKVVNYKRIKFREDLIELNDILAKAYNYYAADGYEGIMIRLNGPYQQTRSFYLYKYKLMLDRDFKVLDLIEGTGNGSGIASAALVQVEYSKEDITNYQFLKDITPPQCKVNVTGSRSQKQEYLVNRNKYIGQYATIRFQEYIEGSGMLRFGELIAFRNYE